MATYEMLACYNTYPSIRPNVRRAVTAPEIAETTQATAAQPQYLPSVPVVSRVGKDHPLPQECTPLNECNSKATGFVRPPSASDTKAELRLSAATTGTKPVFQSDPPPDTMVTISRDAYPTFEHLCKFLETHSLFHTHANSNSVTVLCIKDLPPVEYHELYNLLAPRLEGFRIKIDFYNTTLIMRRPSQTHESGITGWNSTGNFLRSQMPMPPELRSHIHWQKGQIDVNLPPLTRGSLRIKCPDACLGPADEGIPTLVLETGYSQTLGEAHTVAKTWLWRLIEDQTEDLEDHAVQCVMVFKINQNLTKDWLPAFQEFFQKQDFNVNRDFAPDPASYLPTAALLSIALTIEIWRNETDTTTGALKREHSVRNRRTCTIPACISVHDITTEELFDTWIWEYLSEVPSMTNSFHTLRDDPPIPRSTPSTDHQNKYFTLYLDDLTSPTNIPQNHRGAIWINVPIKMWVWGYLLSQGVGVGFKGWKREAVGGLDAAWAKWDRGNKENHDSDIQVVNEERVLQDLGADNAQPRVQKRKLQTGL
ncbi:hypothetical protein EV426DRAFT_578941 [Tirmania nivea]|nr:hypothetical protein EV426DRAFT_578941 [Tirmania nivea]